MTTSNDHQNYGKDDQKNQSSLEQNKPTQLSDEDLKGKKVDGDPTQETDQPIDQQREQPDSPQR